DSLGYLTLDGAYRAVGLDPDGLCTACFSGDYPVPVQLDFEVVDPKLRLESRRESDPGGAAGRGARGARRGPSRAGPCPASPIRAEAGGRAGGAADRLRDRGRLRRRDEGG